MQPRSHYHRARPTGTDTVATGKTITLVNCSIFVILLTITGQGTFATAQTAQETPQQRAARIQQRINYFYTQRSYPLSRIPMGAREQALHERRTMPTAHALSLTSSAAPAAGPTTTPAWQQIGPQPINPVQPFDFWGAPTDAGRVTALAVDPTNSSVVYLGAAEGGVWKSTDGGATWTALMDNQPSLAVGSIAIDPTNPSTIYVGTGEWGAGDNYYGAGVLKSTDGGQSWTQLGTNQFKVCRAGQGANSLFAGSYIASIAVDSANNQVLLAAVEDYCGANSPNNGIYRSTDGGTTWTDVLSGASASNSGAAGSSVLFAVTTSGSDITVKGYAALGDVFGNAANGIYTSTSTSTDGGATWSPWSPWVTANGTGSNVVPTGTSVTRIVLAGAPTQPGTLYAAFAAPDDTLKGLFKTTDGGGNWSKLSQTPDFCATQCGYNLAVAVSPADANIVYAAGIYTFNTNTPTTVIGSTDGGATWTSDGNSLNGGNGKIHTDAHALAFTSDGATIFVGSDGGAWRGGPANDPTKLNWTGLNATLATATFYPGFALNQSDSSMGIGGTQDNGSVVYTGTTTWTNATCGDGGFSAIDHTTTPPTFYTACTFDQGISKSTNPTSFNSWTKADTGINFKDPALFIPPMVSERKHPSTLYYGTNRVYKTTDGGASWAPISPQPLPANGGKVSTIAVSPSKPATIYEGASDGTVAVTRDGGGIWTDVTGTGVLPPRYVTHIEVADKTPTTAYITFSGFSGFGDTLGHVFKTTDGGTNWTDITSNLPNIPANDLAVDRASAGTLYLATDVGVFVTTDDGATWSPLGTGLPNVAVVGLEFHENSRELVAVTHGRSAWKIKP